MGNKFCNTSHIKQDTEFTIAMLSFKTEMSYSVGSTPRVLETEVSESNNKQNVKNVNIKPDFTQPYLNEVEKQKL